MYNFKLIILSFFILMVTAPLLADSSGLTDESILTLKGHTGGIGTVAFSPDGKILASGGWDGIRLWDPSSGKSIRETDTGRRVTYNSICFGPNSNFFVTGSEHYMVPMLWDSESWWNAVNLVPNFEKHTDIINSVSISQDGSIIASGSKDKTVRLWHFVKKKGKYTRIGIRKGHILKGHTKSIASVAISPGGTHIASGSWDDTVILWETKTGKLIKTLTGHSLPVLSVVFSPDGKLLASGCIDKPSSSGILGGMPTKNKRIKLWSASTGKLIRNINVKTDDIHSLAFSPDGKILAAAGWDYSVNFSTIKLWNVKTGKLIRSLKGHYKTVLSVAFSPDGKTLASGSNDTTVKLWAIK